MLSEQAPLVRLARIGAGSGGRDEIRACAAYVGVRVQANQPAASMQPARMAITRIQCARSTPTYWLRFMLDLCSGSEEARPMRARS